MAVKSPSATPTDIGSAVRQLSAQERSKAWSVGMSKRSGDESYPVSMVGTGPSQGHDKSLAGDVVKYSDFCRSEAYVKTVILGLIPRTTALRFGHQIRVRYSRAISWRPKLVRGRHERADCRSISGIVAR